MFALRLYVCVCVLCLSRWFGLSSHQAGALWSREGPNTRWNMLVIVRRLKTEKTGNLCFAWSFLSSDFSLRRTMLRMYELLFEFGASNGSFDEFHLFFQFRIYEWRLAGRTGVLREPIYMRKSLKSALVKTVQSWDWVWVRAERSLPRAVQTSLNGIFCWLFRAMKIAWKHRLEAMDDIHSTLAPDTSSNPNPNIAATWPPVHSLRWLRLTNPNLIAPRCNLWHWTRVDSKNQWNPRKKKQLIPSFCISPPIEMASGTIRCVYCSILMPRRQLRLVLEAATLKRQSESRSPFNPLAAYIDVINIEMGLQKWT